MATKYYDFIGTVKWAKVYAHQKDVKYDEDGVYTVDFYPINADEWEKIKLTGLQVTPKSDNDGEEYLRLRRKHVVQFGREFKEMGPPEVRFQGRDFTDPIGNGSSVRLNVSVYDTKKGKGHRIERVTITNLVEYTKPDTGQAIADGIPF